MSPTGTEREGLPVYTHHRNADAYETLLTQGFSGRLLRLFRWEQQFRAARDGTAVEPAYLLISQNEGGFPRVGFWLDGARKADVGYVDLSDRLDGSGRFGALDQIFPHELMHVIVHQLAAPPPPGASGANQVHAIGVRTDRVTAFDEGFAEHAQVMAVDDPDARPATAALRHDAAIVANAEARLDRYHRALDARWAPAPPARMGFVAWFSQAEQALRYHAVKANQFAREPSIRLERYTDDDLYAAYLLENVLPGSPSGTLKSTPRMLATEGVIAALFSRWVVDPELQRPADAALYDRFAVRAMDLAPIEHPYLKLFAVLADRQPHDAATVIRAYVAAFPLDEEAVARIVRGVGMTWPVPDVPELWMANGEFKTGTTLFDQYRAQPRVHTFDLNAASMVDLLTVPGLSVALASEIRRAAPFSAIADLERVPGMTAPVMARMREMPAGMAAVRDANARNDIESLDLSRLIRPVIVRGIIWALLCAVAAAGCYRAVRRTTVWRVVLNGVAAALFSLVPAWLLGASLQVGTQPVAPMMLVWFPLVLFGVPGAIWQLAWRRTPSESARVLAAWTLACVPALLISTPLL